MTDNRPAVPPGPATSTVARRTHRWRRWLSAIIVILVAGFAVPDRAVIPVSGATPSDWNPDSFWHEPWGSSGVHKGIDIFSSRGRNVLAASPGVVVYRGTLKLGGNVVVILGPKWRLHYYAHLDSIDASAGSLVAAGTAIGTVGDSGNAVGKPPHLHYAVVTPLPYPWLFERGTQGWKRMFFLDPGDRFTKS